MSLSEDVQELGLVVGRIVTVATHPGARAPSHLVTVDLGAHGRHECGVPAEVYDAAELEGKQVVCARRGDELLVLAAHSHASGHVLVGPDRDVEDGAIVG